MRTSILIKRDEEKREWVYVSRKGFLTEMLGHVDLSAAQFAQQFGSFHGRVEWIAHFEEGDAQTVDVDFLKGVQVSWRRRSIDTRTSVGAIR